MSLVHLQLTILQLLKVSRWFHISLSGSNGDVTITGLVTDRIVLESLVVSGVSTFQGNLDLDDNDKPDWYR